MNSLGDKFLKQYIIILMVGLCGAQLFSANLSNGSSTAKKFGVHEISLIASGSYSNPFDVVCKVTFKSPSGSNKTVEAFNDGGNTWKARCYVNQVGKWTWSSSSSVAGLGSKSGSFSVTDSSLKGIIKKHPSNKSNIITDNGKWFSAIGDTGYFMLGHTKLNGGGLDNTVYQTYTQKVASKGMNFIRANLFGGLRTQKFHTNSAETDISLPNLKNQDGKLTWMLNNYPGMYLQLIIFKEGSSGLTEPIRTRFLRQLTARWGAFPTITWMVMNDSGYSSGSTTEKVCFYTWNYIKNNSPFNQLMTTGARRGKGAPYATDSRVQFLHYETFDALSANETSQGRKLGKYSWCGEDRYSTYKAPANKNYFFRRLIWAWIISGGSACYGGDWDNAGTYHFAGTDHLKYINPYFESRNINMGDYTDADGSGKNLNNSLDINRVQIAKKGSADFIIYHPNNTGGGENVNAANSKAKFEITLPSGSFNVEWFNPVNGNKNSGGTVSGGSKVTLTSPFNGDAICRLKSGSSGGDTSSPSQPQNLEASASSSTSIHLSWNASTDNVAVTGYNIYQDGIEINTVSSISTTINGLNPDTSYSFSVEAKDAAGNLSSKSAVATAKTNPAAVDTIKPSIPLAVNAVALSSSSIKISWQASTDNVGVVGYDIYRGSTLIDSTSSTTYTNSGLSADTSYSYNVAAKDAAGNKSDKSATVSAKTLSPTSTSGAHSLVGVRTAPTTINLRWQAPVGSPELKEYGIVLGANGSVWKRIKTVSPSTTEVNLTSSDSIKEETALLQVRAVKKDGTKLDMSEQITVAPFSGEVLYTLSVSQGSGSGEYNAGTIVNLQANTPEPGKAFDRWTGDIDNVEKVDAASTKLTMPATDVTLIATYQQVDAPKYDLTVIDGQGEGSYSAGALVIVTAYEAPEGKVFDQWTGDVEHLKDPNSDSTELTMPANSVVITASYKDSAPLYDLTVIGGLGEGSYKAGEKVNIKAYDPPEGKEFDRWTGDVQYIDNPDIGATHLVMPAGAVVVTALFRDGAPKYDLTVSGGLGEGQYEEGVKVDIKAYDPEEGKEFDQWAGDTNAINDIRAASTFLTMPASAVVVTATFKDVVDEDDLDGDGLPNNWEIEVGLNPNDASDSSLDNDEDKLSNLDEYKHNTNPFDADSDNDGLQDGEEIGYGKDPLSPEPPVILHTEVIGDKKVGGDIKILVKTGHPGGLGIKKLNWSLESTPQGFDGSLLNQGVSSAELNLSVAGLYIVSVTAIDLNEQSSENVKINIVTRQGDNFNPVADAGPNQTGNIGSIIKLHGMNSSDVEDQKPSEYQWIVLKKPFESVVEISNATAETAEFTPGKTGLYIFALIVKDSSGASSGELVLTALTDLEDPADGIVVVKVNDPNGNNMPRAQMDDDEKVVEQGASVAMDASQSSDLDGDDLTFTWTFIDKPTGSQASIDNPDSSTPSFTPDRPGLFVAQVTVKDENGNSDVQLVRIISEGENNHQPVVDAGTFRKFTATNEDLVIELTGTASDVDDDISTTIWSQTEGPGVDIDNANQLQASFTIAADRPRKAGLYRFMLTVTDQSGFTVTDKVAVIINTSDEHVPELKTFEFPELKNSNGENRIIMNDETRIKVAFDTMGDEGETMTVFWTQIKGPSVFFKFGSDREDDLIENEVLIIKPSIAGEYVFKVYVDDGKPRSDEQEISFKADPAAELATPGETNEIVTDRIENNTTTNATLNDLSTEDALEETTTSAGGGGGGCLISF